MCAVALVGGGTYPTPGEISLAHNGVLFFLTHHRPDLDGSILVRQPHIIEGIA